jgi:hypothetical protein
MMVMMLIRQIQRIGSFFHVGRGQPSSVPTYDGSGIHYWDFAIVGSCFQHPWQAKKVRKMRQLLKLLLLHVSQQLSPLLSPFLSSRSQTGQTLRMESPSILFLPLADDDHDDHVRYVARLDDDDDRKYAER